MKSAYVLFQDICICAGDVIQFSVVTPSFPDFSATREGFHYRGMQLNVNYSILKLSQEHIRLRLV